MEAQHMTQQTFANFIGMSAASLSSIFNNRTKPTLNTVEAIKAKIPNINVDWLLFGTGEMFSRDDTTAPLLITARAQRATSHRSTSVQVAATTSLATLPMLRRASLPLPHRLAPHQASCVRKSNMLNDLKGRLQKSESILMIWPSRPLCQKNREWLLGERMFHYTPVIIVQSFFAVIGIWYFAIFKK